jgi:hypothetical protein
VSTPVNPGSEPDERVHDRRSSNDIVATLVAEALGEVRARDITPDSCETPDAEEVAARAEARRQRWMIRATLAMLAISVLMLLPKATPDRILPDYVIGEWRADSPRYSGRFLKLSPDRVVLGFGESASTMAFVVNAVRQKAHRDTTLFEVDYMEGGGINTVRFKFIDDSGVPTLYLPNPVDVPWTQPKKAAR